MNRLEQMERLTKIALSTAVVGTVCKIALERHKSHMFFRKKVGEVMTAIGPHQIDSEKSKLMRFCMTVIKRP